METAADGMRRGQPFFAASQYRDGLIIALMAARPLRIRNFQDIELLRTLVHRSGTYRLVFGEDETKTGRPLDVEVPRPLTPYLERYLHVHRSALLSKRPTGTKPTVALWVSRSGEKMQEPAMRYNIKRRTKSVFGHAINPHLFRDCAATSFATDDPKHVRCIAPLLGHTTLATSDKYYNQATMLTAVRVFSSTMMKIRNDLLEIFDDRAIRAFLVEAQQLKGPEDGI
jgi:site-specific recombinase XerD